MNQNYLRLAPLLALLLLTLAMAAGLLTPKDRRNPVSPIVGAMLPEFAIPLAAAPSRLFLPALWRGEVAVINLFASWCQPCKAEHPLLMQLAKIGGVNLYGIAWKDPPAQLSDYLAQMGNPYRAVGMDQLGRTTLIFGVGGIPETYVVDKTGRVRWKFPGPLTEDIINRQLLPTVQALNEE